MKGRQSEHASSQQRLRRRSTRTEAEVEDLGPVERSWGEQELLAEWWRYQIRTGMRYGKFQRAVLQGRLCRCAGEE